MGIMVFIGIYFVFGILAQIITHHDLLRSIGNAMVGDTGIVFHLVNEDTGEREDHDASELSCDDEIVKNTIIQGLEERNLKKNQVTSTVIFNLAWACLWPIMMPMLLWYCHKYVNELVYDIVAQND